MSVRVKLTITDTELYILIAGLHSLIGVLIGGAAAKRDVRRAERLLSHLERLRPGVKKGEG